MSHPSRFIEDRRRHPRRPAAYAFWVQRTDVPTRLSAWMLDISSSGAAFLAACEHTPRVGERLELAEMHSADPFVREGALPLPPVARVVRLDESAGVTRRVAVRFVCEVDVPLQTRRRRYTGAALSPTPRRGRLDDLVPPPNGEYPASGTILL